MAAARSIFVKAIYADMSMRRMFLAVRNETRPRWIVSLSGGVFVYIGILQSSLNASGTSTHRGLFVALRLPSQAVIA